MYRNNNRRIINFRNFNVNDIMRQIKFKAKRTYGKEWIEGYYMFDGKFHYMANQNMGFTWDMIDPETLCQFTGKTTCKGNEIFENCIVFDEVSEEDRDRRVYFVCKWIDEWSRFVLLHLHEIMDYENSGVEELEDDGTFGMKGIEKLHYAGNYIDNPELLEKGVGDENEELEKYKAN